MYIGRTDPGLTDGIARANVQTKYPEICRRTILNETNDKFACNMYITLTIYHIDNDRCFNIAPIVEKQMLKFSGTH